MASILAVTLDAPKRSSQTLTMHKSGSSLLRHGRLSSKFRKSRPYATALKSTEPAVEITTLPNRIRVATDSTPGHFSSLGLYVDAGSRYEWPEVSGVSHFLDRMAFKVSFLLKLA